MTIKYMDDYRAMEAKHGKNIATLDQDTFTELLFLNLVKGLVDQSACDEVITAKEAMKKVFGRIYDTLTDSGDIEYTVDAWHKELDRMIKTFPYKNSMETFKRTIDILHIAVNIIYMEYDYKETA